MSLFGRLYKIFNETNRNFAQLVTNTKKGENDVFVCPLGDAEADSEDKAVATIASGEDYLQDDVWECMANFCGKAFMIAMDRACDKHHMTNPLKMFHDKDDPQTLCVSLKKGVDDDIKLPAQIVMRELEKLEKLIFSDWREAEIDDSGDPYLVKTFNNEKDRDTACVLIKSMAKVYGIKDSEVYLEPEEFGSNCTLLIKKDMLVTLANREETYECNISRMM